MVNTFPRFFSADRNHSSDRYQTSSILDPWAVLLMIWIPKSFEAMIVYPQTDYLFNVWILAGRDGRDGRRGLNGPKGIEKMVPLLELYRFESEN